MYLADRVEKVGEIGEALVEMRESHSSDIEGEVVEQIEAMICRDLLNPSPLEDLSIMNLQTASDQLCLTNSDLLLEEYETGHKKDLLHPRYHEQNPSRLFDQILVEELDDIDVLDIKALSEEELVRLKENYQYVMSYTAMEEEELKEDNIEEEEEES